MSAPEVKDGLFVSVEAPLITTQRSSGFSARECRVDVSWAIESPLRLFSRRGLDMVIVAFTPEEESTGAKAQMILLPAGVSSFAAVFAASDEKFRQLRLGIPCGDLQAAKEL